MTIKDIEDLLDILIDANHDYIFSICQDSSTKSQSELCDRAKKDLMDAIEENKKQSFDAGYLAGIRER